MFLHSINNTHSRHKQPSREKAGRTVNFTRSISQEQFFTAHGIPLRVQAFESRPDQPADVHLSEPLSWRSELITEELEKRKNQTKGQSIAQALIAEHERIIAEQKATIDELRKQLLQKRQEIKEVNIATASNILLSRLEVERLRELTNKLALDCDRYQSQFSQVQKCCEKQLQTRRLALSGEFQVQLKQLRNQMKTALEQLKTKHQEMILQITKQNQQKLAELQASQDLLSTENSLLRKKIEDVFREKQRVEAQLSNYISSKIQHNIQLTKRFKSASEGNKIREEYEQVNRELEVARGRIMNYQVITQKLKNELAACSEEIIQLKRNASSKVQRKLTQNLQQKPSQFSSQNANQSANISVQNSNMKSQETRQLQQQITKLNVQIMLLQQQSQKQLKIKQLEIKNLHTSIQKLKLSMATLQAQKQDIYSQLEASKRIKHILSDANTQETSLQTDPIQEFVFEENTKENSQILQKIISLDRIQGELKEIIQYQQQEINQRDCRIMLLENHITEIKSYGSVLLKEKEEKIQMLLEFNDKSKDIQALETEVARIELQHHEENRKHLEEISALKGTIDKLERQNRQFQGSIALKDEQIEQYNAKISELQQRITQNTKQIASLKHQLDDKNHAMEQLVNMYQEQIRTKAL